MVVYKKNLSVLIATYNRRSFLGQCLEHLIDRGEEHPEEVVVVVGGRDGSSEMIREYQNRYRAFKLVEVENKSLGDSQNRGLPYCTGDIVATLDDDAFVFPDWAKMVKRAHIEHPEAGCIGGRIINLFPNNVIARLESHVGMPYDKEEGFYTRTVAGVSCTYKREAMEKVGTFDESLPAGMDTDYNWRVLRAGYKVWFDPRIRMYHRNRTTLLAFLKQQTWYGRGYYLVRRKNPDLYSDYPRDLKRWQDWVKLLWFIPGIFSESVRNVARTNSIEDKMVSIPLLIMKEIWWRKGWLQEWISSVSKNNPGNLRKETNRVLESTSETRPRY